MNSLRSGLLILCLIALSGCSGGTGGGSAGNSSSPSIISASQVEATKLKEAISADPVYKIDNSEIALLQSEGVITEADKAQLEAIK